MLLKGAPLLINEEEVQSEVLTLRRALQLARWADGSHTCGPPATRADCPRRSSAAALIWPYATNDKRQVTVDGHARYFGTELNDQSLTPGDNPRIGPTRFEDWLSRSLTR
jgi:hypothetical protein